MPLKSLPGIHMFSAFVAAIAKTPELIAVFIADKKLLTADNIYCKFMYLSYVKLTSSLPITA